MDGVKLFYDGTDIAKYAPVVVGFTTNTSFMKAAGKLSYTDFYNSTKEAVAGKPISLQAFDDDPTEQALAISALGENVYAKIPVIDVTGAYNLEYIGALLAKGVRVNITAVFTIEQCERIAQTVSQYPNASVIVSIFAGRITDTAEDPLPIIRDAVRLFAGSCPCVEVLWAGCKTLLDVRKAKEVGCQIVTVPGDLLDKLGRIGKDLTQFSIDTVVGFKKDGAVLKV
jgi:transaldolase